jgi:hypothetical protein
MDFAKNFGIKELLQKQAGRLLDNTAKDLEWNGQTLPAGFVNHVYMASLNGKFAAVAKHRLSALIRTDGGAGHRKHPHERTGLGSQELAALPVLFKLDSVPQTKVITS